MSKVQRIILLALALLWLLLRIPFFGARYSFEWDSSQFARAVTEFNIFKHQPHPPGYYLWVLATGGLTPLAGNPMNAQVVLSFLMALAALAVFYRLALRVLGNVLAALTCTILLAYSPAVSLHSSISLTSIADLLSSCVAGYLTFLDPRTRQWRIVISLGALGLLAGFRQSGVVLLVPLVIAALILHWREAQAAIRVGIVLAGILFFAWYLPLADTVGGWITLTDLTAGQFHSAAAGTSIFFGAPLKRHVGMIEENIIYFAMNLAAWVLAYGWMYLRQRSTFTRPPWLLYALWVIPNVSLVFGVHGAMVGYCLLTFPPLILLCASIVERPWLPATLAGVAAALAISYFPYGRFLSPDRYTADYLVYRSTPRFALDVEQSQRKLDETLVGLQRAGATEPFVCARGLPEAPNIRTVTFDFNYVQWMRPDKPPSTPSIWLFDWRGPDTATRAVFANWRRVSGDQLWSVWEVR